MNKQQSNHQKGVKVLSIKKSIKEGKKLLEIKLEADEKLFQGADWLVSLGRIEPLEESIRTSLKNLVFSYLESAKSELKSKS